MLRTHTCGELSLKEKAKEVTLCGWVHTNRNHGGIIFVNLRDRYGVTQLVFDSKHNKEAYHFAEKLNREDVLKATGKVRYRGKDLVNKKMSTGEVEILVDAVEMLNKSAALPIEPEDANNSDDIRLKYRYLDLRRPAMQEKMILRHNVAFAVREFLSSQKFLEIETPLLMKSTPEGARDYVVPSRVNVGQFYALPQSPQLYKQILMVSGFDRYFQLPRCLRDEDLRADRQPEHTQIDLEMSFVQPDDVFELVENMFKFIFKKVLKKDLKIPFKRLSYKESMEKYGNDKPDLRFGLELVDVSSLVKDCEFGVFSSAVKSKGIVKGVVAEGCAGFSRKQVDKYIDFAKTLGGKGLAWMKVTEEGLDGGCSKFFDVEMQGQLIKKMKASPGDLLLFCADSYKVVNDVLSKIRVRLGKELKVIDESAFAFSWVTQFPLFEWDSDRKKWNAMHHMFCMPLEEDMKYLEEDPGRVHCTQYDLALNGTELGSGSIRIHKPELQERVMKVVGFSLEEAQSRFGFLLESFKYGAPPHGGIALGLDRVVALLCGLTDIREVIAFPKNKHAQGLMDGCPSIIDKEQLKELGISLKK
jgi:aspartyl-tRNA synthetase